MARQTLGQKAYRALRLLLGLRNPGAARAMVAHGFTAADMQDGFQRLAALTGIRMEWQSPIRDQEIVDALDQFENTWFPVTRATLEARYPQMRQAMFRNLSQYTGVEVIISVSTFLKRLEQMEKGEGEFGKTGPQARALLAQRGLTAQMVAEATARIGALAHFTPEPISEGPSAAEQKAAEDHLWAWYLEWSAIARVAIKDGRLLRGLGFGQRPRVTHVLPETPRPTPVAPVLAPLVALSPTSATPMLNAVSQ